MHLRDDYTLTLIGLTGFPVTTLPKETFQSPRRNRSQPLSKDSDSIDVVSMTSVWDARLAIQKLRRK